MKSANKPTDGVQVVYHGGKHNRRARAKERLEAQLKSGVKPNPVKSPGNNVNVPLTDHDIKRIEKEIEILKSKV
jgi:hypothetical protein